MKMHRKFTAIIAALFVFSFLVFGHSPMFSVRTAEAGFFDWLPWVDSEAEVTAEGEVAVETEDGVLEIWWEYFVGLFGFADDDTEEDADDEAEEVESSSSPEGAMMELKTEEAVEGMVEGGAASSESSAMEGSSSSESSISSAQAEEGTGMSASAEVKGEVEVKTAE